MEQNLECPICLNSFNTIDLRPKSLPCGHCLCSSCVFSLFSANSAECPLCKFRFSNTSTFPDNYALLSQLQLFEISCYKHRERVSSHFDTQLLIGLCSECLSTHSLAHIVEKSGSELSTLLIQQAIDLEIKYASKLGAEGKLKLRQVLMVGNSMKIVYLRDVIKEVECIKCAAHEKKAVLIDKNSGEAFCDLCPTTGSEISLDDPESDSLLFHSIQSKLLNIDCFLISPFWKKSIFSLSDSPLSSKLLLLRYLSKKSFLRLPISVPLPCGQCCFCDAEFSLPSNPPLQLPCPALHLLCSSCASSLPCCPLDHSPFSAVSLSSPSPSLLRCPKCDTLFSTTHAPMLQPCGTVLCKPCLSPFCAYCDSDHAEAKSKPRLCRFFLQLADFLHVRCANDGESSAYFLACKDAPDAQPIDALDLAGLVLAACHRKASALGPRLTPVLAKQLADLASAPNSAKLEFYRLLEQLSAVAPVVKAPHSQGFGFPPIAVKAHVFQRFRTVLPLPGTSTKPWIIDRKNAQVEALVFSAFRNIALVGVSVACPLGNQEGKVEYLEIVEGERIGGRVVQRAFCGNRVRGVVADLMFDNRVEIREMQRYLIVFKIDAEAVFKGNPLEKGELRGSDGTEFEVGEAKLKGVFMNGQAHISGPLIRFIYL
jgi:hypothetical protein